MITSLLALLLASTSTSTPARSAAAEPRPMVRATSRTYVLMSARPYYSTAEGRLVEQTYVPIIQELFLEAEPGLEGVTVAVDGWLGVDAGDQVLADRALADLDQGWVRWRKKDFTLVVGRTPIFSLTGRGLRVDGGHFKLHPAKPVGGFRFSVEGWGGLPVNPTFGQQPLASSAPIFVDDPQEVARGSADWARPGDWAVGVGAGTSYKNYGTLSVGYMHVRHLSEVGTESLIGRVSVTPIQKLDIDAFGAVDLYGRGLEEAYVDVYVWPLRDLRLGIYGRYADPALLLPSTSILSVFGGPEHLDAGLSGDLFFGRVARVSAHAELRHATADVDSDSDVFGGRGGVSVRGRLPYLNSGTGTLGYEFLKDGWYGQYHQANVGAEVPIVEMLSVSVDSAIFVYGRIDSPGVVGPNQTAYRVGAAGNLHFERWRFVLAVRATDVSDLATDVSVMGRFEWNVVQSF